MQGTWQHLSMPHLPHSQHNARVPPGRSPLLHLAAPRHKSESIIFYFLSSFSLCFFFFFPVSILFLVQLFCFVLFPFLSIGTTQIPLLIGASGSLLVTSYYISQGFAFSSRRLLQQCPQHNSVLWRVPLPLELLVAHIQH